PWQQQQLAAGPEIMNDLTFDRSPNEDRTLTPRLDAPGGALPIVLRLLRIAKRRKWLLLGSLAVAAIIGLIGTMLMTRQYTATATLQMALETHPRFTVPPA